MPSFGENLKRERELRGIELREIADTTNISIRFLQALEQDRIDVLPGGIFRRAFVRQYARCVGLDAERLVSEFVYAYPDDPAVAERHPVPSRPALGGPPRGALVVALLLAAGILALLKAPARSREAVSPVTAAPSRVLERPDAAARVEATQEATADGLVLTLSAHQACWVAAEVDGQTVLNKVMNEGETETIQASGEIILSVGNAGGVTFRVNDRQGVPLGRSGEVKRNIIISKKSLPSLVQTSSPPGSHS